MHYWRLVVDLDCSNLLLVLTCLVAIQDERQRLMTLLETKGQLEGEKEGLLSALFVRDAEEIFKAYEVPSKWTTL
jgi:hypothetical protein